MIEISWDGEHKDGAAKISLAVVAVTKGEGLLVVYCLHGRAKEELCGLREDREQHQEAVGRCPSLSGSMSTAREKSLGGGA